MADKGKNPLDEQKVPKKDESGLIENIVSTETSEGEESILGEAPELDTSLLHEIEPPKSISLMLLKILFSILFFASVGSVLFFTSQLTPRFDFLASNLGIPSAVNNLSTANSEVVRLQTEVNLYRHLQIKSFLDKFSFYGDSFVRNYDIATSQTASRLEREEARQKLPEIRKNLATSFLEARRLIVRPIHVPIVDIQYPDDASLINLFRERLRATIMERMEALREDGDYESRKDYRNYQQTLNLVGNTEVRNVLRDTDFEALDDQELYVLVHRVNSLVVNDMSVIQEINSQRIRWSDIIDEIELRTMSVDAYYSRDFFDEVGGIRYTSFDFDAANRRISITGETRTISTTTFTMIADLIDELNSSSMFKNGEMRSFSKSGSLEDGYTGSIRLTLDLEEQLLLTD